MSERQPIIVTIDGPAGAGKSTVARTLAQALGYRLLDTGALYRSVALVAQRTAVPWDDEPGLVAICEGLDIRFQLEPDGEINHVWIGDADVTADIRAPGISHGSSLVSALPGVRAALLDLQRRLGAAGGVVVEGRDTGTVVFPQAQAKFFLTASDEVRARRRHEELAAGGVGATLAGTLSELRSRDARDAGRAVAPLTQAPDAIRMDSSTMTVDQVVAAMLAVVRQREQNDR